MATLNNPSEEINMNLALTVKQAVTIIRGKFLKYRRFKDGT